MNAAQILRAAFLDILFEGRNKAYGAYQIRLGYSKRLKISLILILCFSMLFFFLITRIQVNTWATIPATIFEETRLANLEKAEELVPKLPTPEAPRAHAPKATMSEPLVTPASQGQIRITTDALAPQIRTSLNSIAPSGMPDNLNTGIINSSGGQQGAPSNTNSTIAPDSTSNSPMNTPEVMPSFPGGEAALMRFLRNHLQMPEGLEPGVQIKIEARFIITMDGKMTSVQISGQGGEFEKEVWRVLKKMPNWIPGKSNGRNVSCYFRLPVLFQNYGD